MHKTTLVTGPTSEPITVDEANEHLRLTDRDTYVYSLIVTARRRMERYLNRALITQSWKVFYNCWHDELLIPYPTLQTVASVKYYDVNGSQQTLSTDYYWTVTTDEPGKIVRKYDAVYPELQYGRPDVIEIAYTAGFGDAASAIPDEIKHAMKIYMTDLHENPGSVVVGTNAMKIPEHISDLIHTYKIYNF